MAFTMGIFMTFASAQNSLSLPNTNTQSTISKFKDCSVCPEMVALPSGEFQMGANEEDWKIISSMDRLSLAFMFAPLTYKIESPQHLVKVQGFALARYDVTREQFALFATETQFVGKGCNALNPGGIDRDKEADWSNPWFSQTDKDPVVCVSWNDSQKYIAWLNSKLPPEIPKYRLPTSEEWEYAARAGTTAPTYLNDPSKNCKFANVGDLQSKKVDFTGYNTAMEIAPCDDGYATTSPVGVFPPNPWGLYDMLGNVGQFTQNCATQFSMDLPFVTQCRQHLVRGSTWTSHPSNVRVAHKSNMESNLRTMATGFRIARDIAN